MSTLEIIITIGVGSLLLYVVVAWYKHWKKEKEIRAKEKQFGISREQAAKLGSKLADKFKKD
jgi:hypothetical protein